MAHVPGSASWGGGRGGRAAQAAQPGYHILRELGETALLPGMQTRLRHGFA